MGPLIETQQHFARGRRDSDKQVQEALPPNPRPNTTLCPHCHHYSCPWLGTHSVASALMKDKLSKERGDDPQALLGPQAGRSGSSVLFLPDALSLTQDHSSALAFPQPILYSCTEITLLASSEAESSALASAKSTPV